MDGRKIIVFIMWDTELDVKPSPMKIESSQTRFFGCLIDCPLDHSVVSRERTNRGIPHNFRAGEKSGLAPVEAIGK